mmetsp:Transcript_24053/g.37095  ORF Transcript_24053/g.37095 Transcript_24053/m.37095 type:complete len:278 (+) Transcript_24053:190-1023(+)|eukprot:CAMPEP_0196811988 /NCGR_PEP_ID=MMETSP1362-20130617/20174_1 /TAXON_ID=163516 /ORGANISM="Leptocylindrus danicus, Strain CCMP1856" /LENGTH=277 /DNA_ID=CAMNT_0042187403 /DNA_START=148 /DNA_END=981 /DNA_ORIENTATION=+
MLRSSNLNTLSRTVLNASRRHWNNTLIAQNKCRLSTDATNAAKETIAKEATTTKASSANTASASSGGGIMSFPKDHPFVFQLGVATAKTSAADLVCQVVAEKKKWNEIDWKRNGIFVVFGFVYLGGFQYWIMVNKYRQWFPTMDRFAKLSFAEKLKDKAGIIDAAKMVLFDVTIHLPMMYFPSYYALKEFVSGHSWNPVDWVMDGTAKYMKNCKEDLTAMIKLWGPSDCVQFVLPLHIRMPFRHMVSFFWTAYVSFTRGAIEKDDEEGVKEIVVEAE